MQEAATLFSALGDTSRLRLMELLFDGPHCVSELAEETGQSMSIISQRLKILHQARLVEKRREGKHIYYSLSDDHIVHLLKNAFDHVEEHAIESDDNHKGVEMSDSNHACDKHPGHVHGPNCGHTAIKHGDHVDYHAMATSTTHEDHVTNIDSMCPTQTPTVVHRLTAAQVTTKITCMVPVVVTKPYLTATTSTKLSTATSTIHTAITVTTMDRSSMPNRVIGTQSQPADTSTIGFERT